MPILIRAGKCMPVTATEVTITLQAEPPHDVFGDRDPSGHQTRCGSGSGPRRAVGLTLHGKKPGAGWEPQAEELVVRRSSPARTCAPTTGSSAPPWTGTGWLFARQDTVEAAWQVVDPVLGDVVPVHPYARGSWGPKRGRPAAARPGHAGTTRRADRTGHVPKI